MVLQSYELKPHNVSTFCQPYVWLWEGKKTETNLMKGGIIK